MTVSSMFVMRSGCGASAMQLQTYISSVSTSLPVIGPSDVNLRCDLCRRLQFGGHHRCDSPQMPAIFVREDPKTSFPELAQRRHAVLQARGIWRITGISETGTNAPLPFTFTSMHGPSRHHKTSRRTTCTTNLPI